MDIQLKRGILDICVLAVLQKEDSYGYKIVKDLLPFVEISESTLYPILKRLESSNLVRFYQVEHNSRLRKYYQITEQGKERISEFICEWEDVMKMYRFIKGGTENE
ncbi:MAG: PadR family transcriptional regulator [Bacillota bacterium]|nr:PadR family transcriptional regulator [Bacillota bacterium]